jgi:protein-tyrosine phosphatase
MEPTDSVVPPMSDKFGILFVCLGNICRSPALDAMLHYQAKKRQIDDKLLIDSCALTSFHIDCPMDARMIAAAKEKYKGASLVFDHRARSISIEDFSKFNLIMAVDREVLTGLRSLNKEKQNQLLLATTYSKRFKEQDIGDPYYNGPEEFFKTWEMAEDSCKGLLDHLIAENLLR